MRLLRRLIGRTRTRTRTPTSTAAGRALPSAPSGQAVLPPAPVVAVVDQGMDPVMDPAVAAETRVSSPIDGGGTRVVLGFADDSVVVLDPSDRRGEQIQNLAGAISDAALPHSGTE